jgi:hypothetical protein
VFVLKETADVERYHWVRVCDGQIEAMIVIQFEGLLDGVEGNYQFGIPDEEDIAGSNYRFSARRIRLGEHEYVHNTWAFDNRESAEDNPGAESDRTIRSSKRKDSRSTTL